MGLRGLQSYQRNTLFRVLSLEGASLDDLTDTSADGSKFPGVDTSDANRLSLASRLGVIGLKKPRSARVEDFLGFRP